MVGIYQSMRILISAKLSGDFSRGFTVYIRAWAKLSGEFSRGLMVYIKAYMFYISQA